MSKSSNNITECEMFPHKPIQTTRVDSIVTNTQEQPFVVPNVGGPSVPLGNFTVIAGGSSKPKSCAIPPEISSALNAETTLMENQLVKGYMISIVSDSSYDVPNPFTISPVGMIETKRISYEILNKMINILFDLCNENEVNTSEKNTVIEAIEIINIINIIDKKNIVFNFECCGCLLGHEFPKNDQYKHAILQFISVFVRQGYTMVFADFSVFTLIKNWTACSKTSLASMLLGECPFIVNPTKCNSQMVLKYSVDELIGCPIPQLQTLGKLSEKGQVHLHALSGTIVFGRKEVENQPYTVNVYTTVTQFDGMKYDAQSETSINTAIMCSAIGITDVGFIGHAVVTYPDGGKIIVSAGHFAELTKIHTSSARLTTMIDDFPEHMRERYTTTLNSANQMFGEAQENVYSSLASEMLRTTSGC